MSDLTTRIENLDPAKAEEILRVIAKRQLRNQQEPLPNSELAAELSAAPEGELAKLSLLVLADDPAMHPVLEAMIENQAAEIFVDPGTMAIGLGALVVLQSYIKFERHKDGTWTFKFEKKPMSDTLLAKVISKLGLWIGVK